MTPKEELIKRLRELDIIDLRPTQLKHAGMAKFYADLKMGYGDPDVLRLISSEIWEQMDKRTTCIAANGYGGISIAGIISKDYKIHLTQIRDEPKKHGKGGWIDSYVPTPKDYVSIYDDVLTTGGTLRRIMEILKPTGAKILGCHVGVKRGEAELCVPLTYLLTVDELL